MKIWEVIEYGHECKQFVSKDFYYDSEGSMEQEDVEYQVAGENGFKDSCYQAIDVTSQFHKL